MRFAESCKFIFNYNLWMDWQTKHYDISRLLFVYLSCAKIAAKFKYPKLRLIYCGWVHQSTFSCAVNYV